ncbi:MAG: 6-phosphofructokinase [Deltaproteobacteria bacterium]|nr:6-phosphofructokinase [Deltaproteobacteria bacterium]
MLDVPRGSSGSAQEPDERRSPVRQKGDDIRRVGIVFSGGPAPAANAVIAAAAISLLDDGREVIGFFDGYTHLQEYHPITHRLQVERHYRILTDRDVLGIRNRRGILIGTARANPGRGIECEQDLQDPAKTGRLAAVYSALVDLEIDALISIGGDDTLKTANYLYLFQRRLPEGARRIRIVHLPKTIDNDYWGIDFTFGFFTSVDVMAKELLNLRADAQSSGSWFIVETMGRKAGWLSYGTAIAGEANLVVATEDVEDGLSGEEEVPDPDTGGTRTVRCLDPDLLVERIVDLMLQREQQVHKAYGIVVLAEGVAEMLPSSLLADVPRDPHGHISLGKLDLGRMVSEAVKTRYHERTGREKKVTSVQLGYESRCAPPHAFDVMLGSQLGIGAYRALVEEGLDGHMVSVSGQLDLHYVPFEELVDACTLRTRVRYITPGSDFHRLARFLETRAAATPHWKVDGSQR